MDHQIASGGPAEIIPPAAGTTVCVHPHPLHPVRTVLMGRPGDTIAELVAHAVRQEPALARFQASIRVELAGHALAREHWHRVRVKPGHVVTISVQPSGGKSTLGKVLLIVVAVAAMVASAGTTAALTGAGMSAFGSQLIGAIVGGAIMMGGAALVGSLTKEKTRQVRHRQRHGIGMTRNELRPGQPLPVVFGTIRMAPDHAAKPYTRLEAGHQHSVMVFNCGLSEVEVSDLRIGKTPLSKINQAEFRYHRRFRSGGLGLYQESPQQENVDIHLHNQAWQTRRTADDITRIQIEISFPGGLYRRSKNSNKPERESVEFDVEYKGVDTEIWKAIPGGPLNVQRKTEQNFWVKRRFDVPSGAYDVRLRRTVRVDRKNSSDDAVWTILRGTRPGSPVRSELDLSVVELKLRATGQLNGFLDDFTVLAQTTGYKLTGEDYNWALGPSSNPSDLAVNTLRSPNSPKTVPYDSMDWRAWFDFWRWCDANGFTFNHVEREGLSVWDLVTKICAAGRGQPVLKGNKFSVAWEDPDHPIVADFSPANSWGFTGHMNAKPMPHALKMPFLNAREDYQSDERIVYADDYDKSNASEIETVTIEGITDPDLVWRHGRYLLAAAEHRREEIEFMTDWERYQVSLGDRIRFAHDTPRIGSIQGNVVHAQDTTITLDQLASLDPGREYGCWLFDETGTEHYRIVSASDAFSIEVETMPPGVGKGWRYFLGERGRESDVYRITGIQTMADMTARIRAVIDRGEIIARADRGTIPEYTPVISADPDLFIAVPGDLAVRALLAELNGDLVLQASLSFTSPRYTQPSGYEVRMLDREDGEWGFPIRISADVTHHIFTIHDEGHYSFGCRAIYPGGKISDWVTLEGVDIDDAKKIPPPSVENFKVTLLPTQGARLDWTPVVFPALSHYEIRLSTDPDVDGWDQAFSIYRAEKTESTAILAAIDGVYLIRPVSIYGVPSTEFRKVILAGSRAPNVVEVLEESGSFKGKRSDRLGTDAQGRLRILSVMDFFDGGDFFDRADFFAGYEGHEGEYVYRAGRKIDLSQVFPVAIRLELKRGKVDVETGAPVETDDYCAVIPEIRTSGKRKWSEWREVHDGIQLEMSKLEFRLRFIADNPSITPFVESFRLIVDMEDRVDGGADVEITKDGLFIEFDKPFAKTPTVLVTGQNLRPGEKIYMFERARHRFGLFIDDADGLHVGPRSIDWMAHGYGTGARKAGRKGALDADAGLVATDEENTGEI